MFDIFSKNGFIMFIFTLPIILFSVAIHETAHAYVAYKLGDKSQKEMGNITLDPFKHIDIFSLVCIALLGFGWGKPTFVDDRNFKNKARDNMLVASAGPIANLVIAVVITLILKVLYIMGFVTNMSSNSVGSILFTMLVLGIEFNIVFFVFNLIPIPPFDGSKVLYYFLPNKGKKLMIKISKYAFWILILFIFTDLDIYIITPIVNFIFNTLIKIL